VQARQAGSRSGRGWGRRAWSRGWGSQAWSSWLDEARLRVVRLGRGRGRGRVQARARQSRDKQRSAEQAVEAKRRREEALVITAWE
jgi:hypothetical protein